MTFEHPVRVARASIHTKRILVVSDIHGCRDLLDALLGKLKYRPGEDTLVIIGDLVQKGRQNLDTIRLARQLAEEENVYVLMGNNDLFTLEGSDREILNHALHFKGRSVLGEMALELGMPLPGTEEETHVLREKAKAAFSGELSFLEGLPHILETERFLFAHAGLAEGALEDQDLEYVLAATRFHETVTAVFQKMLLVGHWPVGNFRTDKLSNAPVYNAAHNVLSIDGGNTLKSYGQLVGVILEPETGRWSWTGVDGYPKRPAPCSQKARPGTAITWPENFVELIEKGEKISCCRSKRDGVALDIPNEFLYEDGKGLRTDDITNALLEVDKGETVSVTRDLGDRLMILKNGEAGFLLLQ